MSYQVTPSVAEGGVSTQLGNCKLVCKVIESLAVFLVLRRVGAERVVLGMFFDILWEKMVS